MRVIEERDNGAILELTTPELRLVYGVLIEVRNGPNAFNDDDWDTLVDQPRELEKAIIDSLQPIVARLTARL